MTWCEVKVTHDKKSQISLLQNDLFFDFDAKRKPLGLGEKHICVQIKVVASGIVPYHQESN